MPIADLEGPRPRLVILAPPAGENCCEVVRRARARVVTRMHLPVALTRSLVVREAFAPTRERVAGRGIFGASSAVPSRNRVGDLRRRGGGEVQA